MDEVEATVLRCSACGRIAERVHTSRWDLRSLSLGVDVKVGDLLCNRCWSEIQEELSQEEALRGPA
jgi:DNA-directed RNA polymerase subunit RPC12/RpoP